MAFVRHESCTSCGSSDGNAVYDDGSTYCFVCKRSTGGNPLKRFTKALPKASRGPGRSETKELAVEALDWLSRYNLTPDELALFSWIPEKRWLCYRDGGFVNARNFSGDGPKYISYGSKPYRVLGRKVAPGYPLCVVEDIISAIVVGRQTKVLPLFGSTIATGVLLERYRESTCNYLALWLDSDKWLEATRLSYSLIGIKTRTIRTDLDPKSLTDEHIKAILNETSNCKAVDGSTS